MQTGKQQSSEEKKLYKFNTLNYLMRIICYKFWKGKKCDFTVEGRLGWVQNRGLVDLLIITKCVIMDKIYPESMLRKQRGRQMSGQFQKMREKKRSCCILSSLPGRKQQVALGRSKLKLWK